jgi:hypothetical protein
LANENESGAVTISRSTEPDFFLKPQENDFSGSTARNRWIGEEQKEQQLRRLM